MRSIGRRGLEAGYRCAALEDPLWAGTDRDINQSCVPGRRAAIARFEPLPDGRLSAA